VRPKRSPRGLTMTIRYIRGSLAGSLLLILAVLHASAVEHPGTLPEGAKCASCHGDKTTGKSVHSAMTAPCTVCHLVNRQDDLTTVDLAMPKDQICFACHERSTAWQNHSPNQKAPCLDCHDAHRSGRRLLLRERVATPPAPFKASANKQ
jgi:predicted CXXCH cytochrome family protein